MIAQEPVQLTVSAPVSVRVQARVPVTVGVAAEPGALDPRTGSVRVQVKLAPGECGGSFAGSAGIVAMNVALAPPPGAAYNTTAAGAPTVTVAGLYTVCAFLDDDEGRQFATDTDTQVAVGVEPPKAACAPGRGIYSARVARKHGHATLLLRTRTTTRVAVRVGHRRLKRHVKACKLTSIRLPGKHGRAKLTVARTQRTLKF